MSKIPPATPGLLFRYNYQRLGSRRVGTGFGDKVRPACLLLPLPAGTKMPGVLSGADGKPADYVAVQDDVIILLIQSDPPNDNQSGIELTPDLKRLCGLPTDRTSWLITSEFNIDSWPNADMELVDYRTKSFVYGKLPGPTLGRVAKQFLELRSTHRAVGIHRPA